MHLFSFYKLSNGFQDLHFTLFFKTIGDENECEILIYNSTNLKIKYMQES